MFTGIIEATAKIKECTSIGIIVERPALFPEISIGQSIAVNGACLSVVAYDEHTLRFDVVPETFSRTNLQIAEIVNLERAMPANGRFEGHIVTGHIDCTTTLLEKTSEGEGARFVVALPPEFKNLVVEKGSICLNGVSLTVASISENNFSVALIPHTLHNTNLGDIQPGDLINIETDIMAKYLLKAQ